MPKEVLLEIFKNKLFVELFIISILYFLYFTIFIKLTLQFLGARIELRRIFPWALGIVLYFIVGKQFIPLLPYSLVAMIIFIIALKLITNNLYYRIILAVIFASLCAVLGQVVIGQTIMSFSSKDVARTLMSTPKGVMLGTLIESVFPSVMLFICSFYNITLVPLKRRITKSELCGVLLLGSLFVFIYYQSVVYLTLEKYVPAFLLLRISVMQILFIVFVVAFAVTGQFFTKTERAELEGKLVTVKNDLEAKKVKYKKEKADFEKKIQDLGIHIEELRDEKIKPQELVDSFKKTLHDMQDASQFILQQINPEPDPDLLSKFTDEDLRIITMIAQGYGNKEIASAINISKKSIGGVITRIFQKAGVEDRTQLAIFGLVNHLIKL